MEPFEPPKYLEKLIAAINDGAKSAQLGALCVDSADGGGNRSGADHNRARYGEGGGCAVFVQSHHVER